MSEEQKTDALFIRIRPSLKARIEADAARLGQSLTTWTERTFEARLAQPDLPFEQGAG